MNKDLISIEQMLMIGSTGRNSGKTTLASALINKFKSDIKVIALKVTTIEHKNGKCQRGGEGCGVCTNLKENFELIEEVDCNRNKDTSLLLSAGADKVYWLKCLKGHLEEGINYFMSKVPSDALIICESNSLRNVVIPGYFVMIKNTEINSFKESASKVIDMADFIIENDFNKSLDMFVSNVEVEEDERNIKIKY
ncbi:hypothetical protein [Clostridium manihotivorum]|uniref:Molybdopterin-guanine dinucleotide biosynthesis protein B n=1 Tax=Clostridium manihotivorum TaxID=2320868 RepID=A0A410E0M7_9CLOT|nr:hypothetical protein [Clostridium manihotivorum]QAA34853.1 hypothetical protein C1I91_26245 [Clostridium manihotivorum]